MQPSLTRPQTLGSVTQPPALTRGCLMRADKTCPWQTQHRRPLMQHRRPLMQHRRPLMQHRQPPMQHRRPPMQRRRPPMQRRRPPMQRHLPPMQRHRPQTRRNPFPMQRNPFPMQRNPFPTQRNPSLTQRHPNVSLMTTAEKGADAELVPVRLHLRSALWMSIVDLAGFVMMGAARPRRPNVLDPPIALKVVSV